MIAAIKPAPVVRRSFVFAGIAVLAVAIVVKMFAAVAMGVPVTAGGEAHVGAQVGGILVGAGIFTGQPEVVLAGLVLIVLSN